MDRESVLLQAVSTKLLTIQVHLIETMLQLLKKAEAENIYNIYKIFFKEEQHLPLLLCILLNTV